MGFSWSLFFAQQSSERGMQLCPSLSESRLVTDREGGLVFDASRTDTVRHTVYVDNLGGY